jgi:hypothetical protein
MLTLTTDPLTVKIARVAWAIHRARVKSGLTPRFSNATQSRWIFITADDPVSNAQIFPFFFYAREIRREYGIELREMRAVDFNARPFRDR